jgi:hypothetical protein
MVEQAFKYVRQKVNGVKCTYEEEFVQLIVKSCASLGRSQCLGYMAHVFKDFERVLNGEPL